MLEKIKPVDVCTLCNAYPETKIHLFVECTKIQPLIEYYKRLCTVSGMDVTEWDEIRYLFSNIHDKPNHIVNFVCIVMKQFIYSCHCAGVALALNKFIKLLEEMQDVEFEIARREHRLVGHVQHWSPIFNFE